MRSDLNEMWGDILGSLENMGRSGRLMTWISGPRCLTTSGSNPIGPGPSEAQL